MLAEGGNGEASRSTRLERERVFHERVFSQGGSGRQKVLGCYSIIDASRQRYRDRLLALGSFREVLEYGCGEGSAAFPLARHGASVVGIDISPAAIASARREARAQGVGERARFEVMNAEALDFPDASFDLVCGTGILHHLDLSRAYAEVARVLKPGGTALFVEPLGHNPLIGLFRRLTPSLRTADEHPLLRRDIENARRHFGSVEIFPYHLHTLAAVPFRKLPVFRTMVRALDAADGVAFRLIPPLRWHAWRVIVEMSRPRAAAPSPAPAAVSSRPR